MPSMNDINEAVFRGKFEDQMSKGAEAAARKLKELGDTVVQTDEKVKKSERSFEQVSRRYDENAKKAAAVARATREYESAVKAVTSAVETGAKTQAQADEVIRRAALVRDAAVAKANAELLRQKAVYEQLDQASRQAALGYDKFSDATSKAIKYQTELNNFLGVNRSRTENYAERAADIAAYGRALDELRARITPLYAAELRFKDAVEEVNRALRAGAITRTEATMANERYRASLEASARAATAASQQRFNQLAGITLPDADKSSSRAADIAAYGAQLDALRAKYVPLEAEMQRYRARLAEVRQAEQAGALTSAEAAQARTRIQNSYDAAVRSAQAVEVSHYRMGRQLNLTSQQLVQLSYQLNDVIAQSAVNTSPFIILAQQGPQVVQALGGITGAWRALVAVMAGGTGIATAAAAAILIPIAVVNSVESRLATIRNSLRAFRDDYRETAAFLEEETRRINLQSPGFSLGSITDSAQTIERTRSVSQVSTPLADLIALARELSRTLDKDLATASQRVAAAMRDPAAAAKELSEQSFPGVTEALRRQIEVLQRSGDRQQAFNLLLTAMRNQLRGADQDVSPMMQALNRLTTAFKDLWETIRPGLEGVGRWLLDWLTVVATQFTNIVELVRSLGRQMGEVSSLRQPSTGAAWSAPPGGGAAPTNVREAIAFVESRGQANNGYGATNPYGYLGRYQFGVPALVDAGVYEAGPRDRVRGQWQNNWSGRFLLPGVNTREDFLASPQAQDAAYAAYERIINRIIDQNRLLEGNPTIQGVPVTRDALIGAGWASPYRLPEFVRSGGTQGMTDGNGVTMLERFIMFSRNTAQGGAVPVTIAGVTPAAAAATTPGNAAQAAVDEAVRRARGYGSNQGGSTRETLLADIRSFSENRGVLEQQNEALRRQQAELDPTTEAWQRLDRQITENSQSIEVLNNGIDGARAAIRGTVSPVEELIRGWENAAVAANDAGTGNAFLRDRLRELNEASMRYRGSVATEEEAARATTAALAELSAQYGNAANQLDRQVASTQRVANATILSAQAGARAEAVERAREEVRKTTLAGTSAEAAAIENLARKYMDLARAEGERQTARRAQSARNDIEMMQAEVNLIGQSAEARERELAVIRERQTILQQDPNADLSSDVNRQALEIAGNAAVARTQLDQYRQSFNEIANFVDQAFERIGGAITEAFANGTISTINWGRIAKAILSEAIQRAVQLALINPFMNWAFGYNRATATSVIGATGSMFGGSSGGGGGFLGGLFGGGGGSSDLMSNASSLYSGARSLYGAFSNGGVTTGIAMLDAPIFTSATGLMGTGFGSSAAGLTSATTSALGGMGALYGPATPAAVGAASASQGGMLGAIGGVSAGTYAAGIGLGFAAGSLIGSSIAQTQAQQTNAMIGAGGGAVGGAVAGAAIGSVVPVIGTAIGAILGGLIGGAGGGALGGLIGPSTQFSGGDIGIGVGSNGMFTVAGAGGKRWNASEAYSAADQQIKQLNQFMTQAGLRLGGGQPNESGIWGGVVDIWGYGQSPNGGGDIGSLFSQMFKYMVSDDKDVQQLINAGRVNDLQGVADAIDWIKSVYQPLSKATEAVSSWERAMRQVFETYDPAIQRARDLGIAEQGLITARSKAYNEWSKQYQAMIRATTDSMRIRELRVTKDPENIREAALLEFDLKARAELVEYEKQLKDMIIAGGAAGGKTQKWVDEMIARLKAVQGLERTDLIEEASGLTGARSSVNGLYGNLRAFVSNLRFGGSAPITPFAQFEASRDEFNRLAALARTGDFTSATALPSMASNYLEQARNIYGGGIGYADAFNQVISAVEDVSKLPSDLLTASAQREIQREQTEILVDELTKLRAEVAALVVEVRQGNIAPASAT